MKLAEPSTSKEVALRFLDRLGSGSLTEEDVSADFQAWSISSGTMTKAEYLSRMPVFAQIFPDSLAFTLSDVIVDGKKIAVRATSEGRLYNGDIYRNSYMFQIEIDTSSKVSRFYEYYDRRPAEDVLYPARRGWLESRAKARP